MARKPPSGAFTGARTAITGTSDTTTAIENDRKKGTTMNYRDRLKKADNERKRRNLRDNSPGVPQTNVFYSDGSFTSETSSGCDSSSSYDSGSSSSSDCGGGSYGE